MSDFIPQMIPWFGNEEAEAMDTYMRSGGFLMEFKQTEAFEQMIAEYTGAKHAIVVNNGTISLTMAAMVCGVQAGDEVIVPNYTMIATPNSIKMIGAVPVFVDVCAESLCLDYEQTKSAITDKTKAIILVNANGRYPKEGIQAFKDLADAHHIAFIEDSAQALGSFYPATDTAPKQHMGTVGTVGSFSFSVPKVISTGQGGALVTNDEGLAQKIRKLKDFGRSGGGTDIHDSIGWNFKFTDMQAVVGIEQMKKLPWRVTRKKQMLKRYQRNLADIQQVSFFAQDLENTTPWFIDVLVSKNRDGLCAYLKQNGVGSRVMYPPINKQQCYQVAGDYPVSNTVGEQGLWLPSSSQLTDAEIDKVCAMIKQFFMKHEQAF